MRDTRYEIRDHLGNRTTHFICGYKSRVIHRVSQIPHPASRIPTSLRDRLPHEKDTTDRHHSACGAQQILAPCPSVDGTDADSQRMQTSGRDHEAHAVKQGALTWRKFGPMGVTMKDGEDP